MLIERRSGFDEGSDSDPSGDNINININIDTDLLLRTLPEVVLPLKAHSNVEIAAPAIGSVLSLSKENESKTATAALTAQSLNPNSSI